ncbi:MAG: DUF255 domain-containing protein [Crocosphaera sp.]|nr:DUF255 domain-containing protein [Crocosphaera sp.]
MKVDREKRPDIDSIYMQDLPERSRLLYSGSNGK